MQEPPPSQQQQQPMIWQQAAQLCALYCAHTAGVGVMAAAGVGAATDTISGTLAAAALSFATLKVRSRRVMPAPAGKPSNSLHSLNSAKAWLTSSESRPVSALRSATVF